MALSDAYDLFTDVCEDIGVEHTAIATQLTQKLAVEAELDVFAAGDPGKAAMQRNIDADRAAYNAIAQRWADKMDTVLGYWGTQLTTPSAYSKGGRITGSGSGGLSPRALLLRDIRSHMTTNSLSIADRAVSYAPEPSAADNGILDRLTVDEYGNEIAAGLHNQTIDATVWDIPSKWQSVIRVQARNKGVDIFNLLGPTGFIDLPAINDARSGGLVTNPNLTGTNTTTNAAAITSCTGWTLTGSATHVWDTSIAFRGLAGSHKMYGNGNSRTFTQPLIVRSGDRFTPRNYFLAVYVTGTAPTGTITVTWGGKTQAFTMGSLSAGWNYLRLDRDRDLYPSQFATAGDTLAVAIAFTSGSDASNYVNLAFFGGQNYINFDGPWYGHWSQNGLATRFGAFSFADTMTSAGKNATALYLAYHLTADRRHAYLRESGSPTIADYS